MSEGPVEVQGRCSPRFAGVLRTFEESFAKAELGASVAVCPDGDPVVDRSGGFADPDARLGFGCVTNRMQSGRAGDARGFALIAALVASL